MRGYKFCACLSLMTLLVVGCGGGGAAPPDLGEVTGVIKVDGKPAEGLSVTFEPKGTRPSTGMTDSEGQYTLIFNKDYAGAAVGSHTVRITPVEDAEATVEPVQIPSSYNTESTLKREVKAGENTFDFDIETKPAG